MNKRIKELQCLLAEAVKEEKESMARMKFPCICGKLHMIKDCIVVQIYHIQDDVYTQNKEFGETQVICPNTNHRNRIFFKDKKLEKAFKFKYLYLFRSVAEEEHENNSARTYKITYYFEEKAKKFGLIYE